MATITVMAGDSIQAAIDAAHNGDTIVISAGTYAENITVNNLALTFIGANHGVDGAASRGAESSIVGRITVTGSQPVTFDGVEFRATSTTGTTGPSQAALAFHGSGAYTVENSVFYNETAGGANDARAISLDTSVSGSVTIDHNAFTGASIGNFSTASWGRGVWSDGTSSELNITNNTFTYVRSGLNLDSYDDTKVDVSHNVFASTGSGISVGTPTGSNFTGIHDNDFRSIGDDFNFQNVTTPVNIDLTGTANASSGGAVGLGGGVVQILGSQLGDHIKGSAGSDSIIANGGDDVVTGGAGNDTIDGGTGTDTVDYSADGGSGAVTVNLATGTATDTFGNTDTLVSIENAIGTSGADTFTSAVNGVNTFTGGGGNDTYKVKAGDVVVEASSGGTDLVQTTDSYTLGANVENLTLQDKSGANLSHTETFDDLPLGPIANGANGWQIPGYTVDQGVVTDPHNAANQVFHISSDPSNGAFGGPFSPALGAAAGEADTGAAFNGQSISFNFQAVNATPDGSRLEVDFGNAAGTDRNNFLVIESFAGQGIRIAVSEPDANGNFSGYGSSAAPNDWRELITGVDPTTQHTLEMRLDYVDGPNNDVIGIYLDGNLIGKTTTFENYHDALGGDHISNAQANLTNRVIFRESYNGQPQDGPGGQNQGFYFDNLTTSVYNNTNGTGNELDNVITGNSGDNQLTGLSGNDTITGRAGNDTIDGGTGTDTVDYSVDGGSGAVTVNLATGNATDTFGNTDTLVSIESAIGTSGADTFTSAASGVNTFTGGGGNDTYNVKAGDVVVEASSGGTDLVQTTDSYTLGANVENLTLQDLSHTETFDNLPLGPITDGEKGWRVLGAHDQEIVDLGGGNHVFRMSSDPTSGDFGGPYSPSLGASAGERGAGAAFDSQSIVFSFNAVNATPDGSRLEVDFGNSAGTDRNNFLVIESFAGQGIRIAVSEPDTNGDFSGNGSSAAPNDWRELITGVDPSAQHTLEMRLHYVDGPNNDKIDVYLDGQYIGQTTTFENYHDALDDSHNGNAAANFTDRVFFRGSANGAPQDGPNGQNQGFYFDNLTTSVYNNTNGSGNELDNVITGNSGDNLLTGLGGNDTINGGAGNDTIDGGAGNDTIDGGSGTDTYVLSGAWGDYSITRSGATYTIVKSGETDTVSNVENFNFNGNVMSVVGNADAIVTIHAPDRGPVAGVTINGTAGDDVIDMTHTVSGQPFSSDGDDTINGGAGNDLVFGGLGNDIINGNAGVDTAGFVGFSREYSIGIHGQTVSGPEGSDQLTDIEIIQFADGRMVYDQGDAAAIVYRMYDSAFGRAPESAGQNGWTTALQKGLSVADMASGFAASPEFVATYGPLDNQHFVEQLYQNVLGREGEAAGVTGWTNALDTHAMSRGQVLAGFSESTEHVQKLAPVVSAGIWDVNETTASIARLYDAAFDRLPDGAGLLAWKDAADHGMSLSTVADGFASSTEFQNTYGNLSNQGFVEQLYHNVLGRSGEAAGVAGWTAALASGQMDRGDVLLGFSESVEHQVNTMGVIDHGIWIV